MVDYRLWSKALLLWIDMLSRALLNALTLVLYRPLSAMRLSAALSRRANCWTASSYSLQQDMGSVCTKTALWIPPKSRITRSGTSCSKRWS